MRRMLDPKEVGGLPSTIEFDKDGNRKTTKNLDVGGKLTLKSLVSNTNQDGDITKELGGGTKVYIHSINLFGVLANINLNYYTKNDKPFSVSTLITAIGQKEIIVTGTMTSKDNTTHIPLYLTADRGILEVAYVKYPTDNAIHRESLKTTNILDKPLPVD